MARHRSRRSASWLCHVFSTGEARISAKILGPQVLLNDTEDSRNANFDAAKAYMNSIGGGTDQIQRNIIAERILSLPKSTDISRDIPFKDVKSG